MWLCWYLLEGYHHDVDYCYVINGVGYEFGFVEEGFGVADVVTNADAPG